MALPRQRERINFIVIRKGIRNSKFHNTKEEIKVTSGIRRKGDKNKEN